LRLFGVGLVELLITLAILIAFVAIATSFARRRRGSGIWSPLHWFGIVAAAALVVVLQVACTPTQPTQPTPVTVIVTTDVTNNLGGGGASPAPGGALPAGSVVKVAAFGQNCPAGTVAPNDGHVLKVGCQLAMTCTPKGPNGELLPPAVTGQAPDSFGVTNGSSSARGAQWDSEAFNLNVVGLQPGPFSVECVDKGLKSERWDGQVIAASASSFDNVTASSRVVYDELKLEDFGPVR
jgi:hypothetical protein